MSTTIVVSRGLCSPMREDVLTALEPFGIKLLEFDCRGYGHHKIPCPDWALFPDADIWVKRHVARVTVSDAQAAWAERLLWKSGKMDLESKPLNPSLKWNAPSECKEGAHALRTRGERYKPWSEHPRRQRRRRTTRRAQQEQRGGLLGWLDKLGRIRD